MNTISHTAVRESLADTISKGCEDHAPVIITGVGSQSAVLLSLEDYESLQETAYLLRSPANATRLSESIIELKRGEGVFRRLEDLSA